MNRSKEGGRGFCACGTRQGRRKKGTGCVGSTKSSGLEVKTVESSRTRDGVLEFLSFGGICLSVRLVH